jgi:type I restriction enzyme M protein
MATVDIRLSQLERFQVPEDCHWRDVRAITTNVGQALQKAMRGIEQANPETLYSIFGDAPWTNKERLSDALLRDLIEHFSRIPLGNEAAQADVLGQSYEYLIKKFADLTNKKAGEFYTPRSVVRLMVNILDPREGESIYDAVCGTGGMLLEAIHHVRERHGDTRTLWGKLFGQEKNLTTSAIARMSLFLHGAADFQIVRGDTLRNPAFFSGDRLAVFDCVIANPPFSLERWGEEVWTNDPYGRNFAGMSPAKSGDYAWVQHMIKSMAPATGRMAVVLSHSALFRMGAEGAIRKKLLTWTCSKPSSGSARTCSMALASPPASSCSASARRPTTGTGCSSSTPRASSRRAEHRTSCCPNTSIASTAGIGTSAMSRVSPG